MIPKENSGNPDYSGNRFEVHLAVSKENLTVVDLLHEETGISRGKIKQILKSGAVWISRGKNTRRIRRATAIPETGSTLHLYYSTKVQEASPPPATLIADEGDYSIWHKPPGMLSQGSKWGDHCTISRWAEQHLSPQRPAFIIHRLDRAASGLIMIAHKKSVAVELARLFQTRKVEKVYQVIVHGEFPGESQTLDMAIDGKSAISHATAKAYDAGSDRSLLEVTIETGRKHQIRRHLADAGHAVVGDRLYGVKTDLEDLQLVSVHLAFHYPPGQWRRSYDLPTEFQLHL